MSALNGTLSPALQRLGAVSVRLSVELGRTQMALKDVLALTEGSVVSLDKLTDELLDITANGEVIAHGEVIAQDGRFALRIVSLADGERPSPPPPSRAPRPDVPTAAPEPEAETPRPQPPVEPTVAPAQEVDANPAPERSTPENSPEAAPQEPAAEPQVDALDELAAVPSEVSGVEPGSDDAV